ncbi:CARDB domain-containing protein, partial [Hymenobacter terrenus]|uniref:CARDB domain-containing protein n=1 Tax=Hymenobacter terrenus TaxID=1629124 RepID=UPI0006195057
LDLEGTATTDYRVATTGAAGARVTTIQWKDVSDKVVSAATGKQLAAISFQVKLYETSNRIELVYGPATAGPGPTASKLAAVGIKGSTSPQTVNATKSPTQAWSLTTLSRSQFGGNAYSRYSIPANGLRNTVLPDVGRTYRFDPSPATDAAVVSLYALGKTPLLPQAVQAVVRNVGTSPLLNLPVTLTVTGVNTFTDTQTIASLAPGALATVSFAAYTPATIGTNTLAVTVPADAIGSNNAQSVTQLITTNTFSHVNTTTPGSAGSFGYGPSQQGAFIAKFTTPVARTIGSVGVGLTDVNSIGNTVYAILVDFSGTMMARSADYVVQPGDINTIKSFAITTNSTLNFPTLPIPVPIAAGRDFYVGLVQTAAVGGTRYFPLATVPVGGARPDTFFIILDYKDTNYCLTCLIDARNGPDVCPAFVLEAQDAPATPLGTSAALSRALSLYPNPT